jgi:hypothetical protein
MEPTNTIDTTPVATKKAKVEDRAVPIVAVETAKESQSPARKNSSILHGTASSRGSNCQCGGIECARAKNIANEKCQGRLSDGTSCDNGLFSDCLVSLSSSQRLCVTCKALQVVDYNEHVAEKAHVAIVDNLGMPVCLGDADTAPSAISMSTTTITESTVSNGIPVELKNRNTIEIIFSRRGKTATRVYRRREFSNEQIKTCSKYLFVEEDTQTAKPKSALQIYWYVMGDAYYHYHKKSVVVSRCFLEKRAADGSLHVVYLSKILMTMCNNPRFDVIFIDMDYLDRGSEGVGIEPMTSFLSNYGDYVQMPFVDLNEEDMEQRVHLYLKQTRRYYDPNRGLPIATKDDFALSDDELQGRGFKKRSPEELMDTYQYWLQTPQEVLEKAYHDIIEIDDDGELKERRRSSSRASIIRQHGLQADLENQRKLLANQQQELQLIRQQHDKEIKKVTTELQKNENIGGQTEG